MTAILGISAFYHDSAAALVIDGEVVAAAQEERFSRTKHDHRFPVQAIESCLAQAPLDPSDLDYVGFYDKPFLKFERLLETYLSFAPLGFRSFVAAMPLWLRQKLHLPREIRRGLDGAYRRRCVFVEHHESHAASAFFPSPFDAAAIITCDGVGEWTTTSLGEGRGRRLDLTQEIRFPHSLGLLYTAFTAFTGFRVNSGEYKLMGLAPYGEPKYVDLMQDELIDIKPDGSFRLDMRYFDYARGLTMTSSAMTRLFGRPPRQPGAELTQDDLDIAASVQRVAEEVMLRMARHQHERTGLADLCLAGGVALNCVSNGRLVREGPFDRIWIQPAAGDAGGALGAALFIWHQLLGNDRTADPADSQRGSLLGPQFSNATIQRYLERQGARYHRVEDEDDLCDRVAELIAAQRVVGWFQGRMEFGPRALGCRSILADPRSAEMQSTLNRKTKFRESFRPFAPSVLRDRADEYFQLAPADESPYMLLVAPVQPDKRTPDNDRTAELHGLDRLHQSRSEIPAVTHVDYSARVQTVDPQRHGRYYELIRRFAEKTGCPVVLNTSFNVRGEPIVCTPEQAHQCFLATHLDALVLENHLLLREEQPASHFVQRDEYLEQFPLD